MRALAWKAARASFSLSRMLSTRYCCGWEIAERPTSAALLKHDFLQAARRDSLVPLIEKAQYFKANPRPKHRVSDASTATNASGTLRASGRTSIESCFEYIWAQNCGAERRGVAEEPRAEGARQLGSKELR